MVCSSDSTDHYDKYLRLPEQTYIIQGEGEVTLKELIGYNSEKDIDRESVTDRNRIFYNNEDHHNYQSKPSSFKTIR